MSVKLILAVASLSLATVANAKMLQRPPRPPPSQVPPPPALRGVVRHIAPSGLDQTATIQATIHSAASSDTIFFDAGTHVVCGMVREKAGQLYVSPSVTFPLLRQYTRATIDGCNNTGGFIPANNTMFYGFNIERMNSYIFSRTTGAKFRNNHWDNHFTGGVSIEWTCHGGDNNTTIDWNTFLNGSGHDNGECSQTGAKSRNYLFTHNAHHYCENDCVGPTDDGSVNEEYSYNLFDRPGQNCDHCGTASAIETAGTPKSARFTENYVTGEPAGGAFCLSIIGGNREVARNYCGGNGAAIEWDPHYAETRTASNVHDNYVDARNIPGGTATILGPYANSPRSTLANNRVLSQDGAGTETSGENDCTFSAGDACWQVSYKPGPTDNPGIPIPPAAGAAP
jgi:hypothetical protein